MLLEGISPLSEMHNTRFSKTGEKNGPLTILTSDTMSMLAMSIFIPTRTGGPAMDGKQEKHIRSEAARVISGSQEPLSH